MMKYLLSGTVLGVCGLATFFAVQPENPTTSQTLATPAVVASASTVTVAEISTTSSTTSSVATPKKTVAAKTVSAKRVIKKKKLSPRKVALMVEADKLAALYHEKWR